MIDISIHNDVICVKGTTRNGKGSAIYLYLVDGMLIDSGPFSLEKELIPIYQKYDFDFVTLTHSHEDHSGTAPWIQQHKKVPIYVHPNGISICDKPGDYPEYRQIEWGVRDRFTALPLGEKIRSRNVEWEVIYTPGHADDHVSLYDQENGRLFTGDMYIIPTVKVMMRSESISIMMDSIRKLLKLDFQAIYCSHAGYLPDGRERLLEKLDNLKELYGAVSSYYKKGYRPDEINQALFNKKYSIEALSKGEYSSINIVYSIISDLEGKNHRLINNP